MAATSWLIGGEKKPARHSTGRAKSGTSSNRSRSGDATGSLVVAVGKAGSRYHKRGVERIEYERMHAVEDRMWWYRGLRALVVQEIARALARRSLSGPLLDAGCGTGGMLAKLASVAGHPALGWEYDATAATLACNKSGRPVACGSVNE